MDVEVGDVVGHIAHIDEEVQFLLLFFGDLHPVLGIVLNLQVLVVLEPYLDQLDVGFGSQIARDPIGVSLPVSHAPDLYLVVLVQQLFVLQVHLLLLLL